jgi:hypothetical protein
MPRFAAAGFALARGALGLLVLGSAALGCGAGAGTGGATGSPSARADADADAVRDDPKAAAARLEHLRAKRCDALCSRTEACGAPKAGECRPSCAAEPTEDLAHVRPDYGWKLVACLDGMDCPTLLGGRAVPMCEDFARQQLPPSPLLKRFCFESTRRGVQCGQPADQSECLDRYRPIDDASLEHAIACLGKPCAEVPACFATSFGYAARPRP